MSVNRTADEPDAGASSNPNDLPFKWPVLGFGRDVGVWSDTLICFRNADQFRTCGRHSYEDGRRVGMVLFDASGRSWEITAVRKLGTAGSIGKRILRWLIRWTVFNIEVDIAEAPSVTFDELKSRIIQTIDANPLKWRDEEALAGESGPPRDEQEMLDELKDRVRKARTIDELIKGAEIIDAE